MSSLSGLKAKSVSRIPRARRGQVQRASLNRFERAVDPDGLLSPEERAWRADQLRTLRKVARVSRRMEVA